MQILRTVPGEYQILDKCFLSLLLALETVAAPPPPRCSETISQLSAGQRRSLWLRLQEEANIPQSLVSPLQTLEEALQPSL